jgi:hypothetical protein
MGMSQWGVHVEGEEEEGDDEGAHGLLLLGWLVTVRWAEEGGTRGDFKPFLGRRGGGGGAELGATRRLYGCAGEGREAGRWRERGGDRGADRG